MTSIIKMPLKVTADLAFENLKEVTYVIFSRLNEFSDVEKDQFRYFAQVTPISEAKTREIYIDVDLKNAGYKLNRYKDNLGHGRPVANEVCVEIEVHNLPNQSVGYIDYVIYDRTQMPIAVIEAKRTSISEEAGAQQARDYADALQKELNLNYRPIIYYTNGYKIKIQDRLGYPAREVLNFASIEDLECLIKRQKPGNIDAKKSFAKYIAGVVSDISAENPKRDLKARVCVCTYNSMLNMLDKPKKEFSVGHFDLIFVDEAHRSLFNVYRAIFDYFDSFLIGLITTPSKALDKSTYEILDLDVDKPTFEVKFDEAVNLGYLVIYKAFDKSSKII